MRVVRQRRAKLLPPGITPPYVLSYNASSVPILSTQELRVRK
jgi:hypothetical protein